MLYIMDINSVLIVIIVVLIIIIIYYHFGIPYCHQHYNQSNTYEDRHYQTNTYEDQRYQTNTYEDQRYQTNVHEYEQDNAHRLNNLHEQDNAYRLNNFHEQDNAYMNYPRIILIDQGINELFLEPIFEINEQKIDNRRNTAKRIAGGINGAASDMYINMSITNTNDTQNSHDPTVTSCLEAIITRLKADQNNIKLPKIKDIISEFKVNHKLYTNDHEILERVIDIIDFTSNEKIVNKLNISDRECIKRIWARANDIRNINVSQKIKQSLFDNIADSWENGIVCVNGRISRILSSLVLLDFDKRNWEVKTYEQFKNDIFNEASKIITIAAVEASESDNIELSNVGKSYLAKTKQDMDLIGPISETESLSFVESTKIKLDQMIDEYIERNKAIYNIDIIPIHMIDKIKQEVCASL